MNPAIAPLKKFAVTFPSPRYYFLFYLFIYFILVNLKLIVRDDDETNLEIYKYFRNSFSFIID